MSRNDSSLLGGLDPASLFALGTDGGGRSTWEPPDLAHAARLFPQWEILRLLGCGGMGAVYLARQPELDRLVAVKILPIEACADEAAVERFRREARTLAKLRHPGIVMLHESGVTPEGHVFFVMEYVDGQPLSEWLTAGKMDVQKAVDVVRQVCDALGYAHASGIIHRDIKPSNILIDPHGQAKLADFGLARRDTVEPGMEISRTGMFVGTPAYTAPEQARDASRVDHRADLYSLGVLLYEMLTGELPRGVFQKPSAKVGSDERLDHVVQRALQERPEDRYQEAAQIKQDVASIEKPAARPWPWRIASAATIALLAIALAVWKGFPRTGAGLPPATATHEVRPEIQPPQPPAAAPPFTPDAAPPAGTSTSGRLGPVVTGENPPSPAAGPPDAPPSAATPTTQTPPALPVGDGVKVISLATISPALRPPEAFTRTDWKDAVLLSDGGVALFANGLLATWQVDGESMIHPSPPGWSALAACGSRVLAISQDGDLHILSPGAPRPEWLRRGVTRVFASAVTGHAMFLDGQNSLILRRGDREQTIPFPRGIQDAALGPGDRAWIIDHHGDLVSWHPDSTDFRREAPRGNQRVFPTATGVIALDQDGVAHALETAAPPSGLKGIRQLAVAGQTYLALYANGSATAWGTSVEDGHQRFRLAPATRAIRISPEGLVVSW